MRKNNYVTVMEGLQKVWNAFNQMEHEMYADYVYDALAFLREQHEELVRLQRNRNWAPRNREADDDSVKV